MRPSHLEEYITYCCIHGCEYNFSPPPTASSQSTNIWTALLCFDRSVCLRLLTHTRIHALHTYITNRCVHSPMSRLLNLELLQNYGASMWLGHNKAEERTEAAVASQVGCCCSWPSLFLVTFEGHLVWPKV